MRRLAKIQFQIRELAATHSALMSKKSFSKSDNERVAEIEILIRGLRRELVTLKAGEHANA